MKNIIKYPKILNAKSVGKFAPNAVYVGRPSIFGNPFIVGAHGTREQVIAKFKDWFLAQPELVKQAKEELAGKDLICWCSPEDCHARILIEIANEKV